MPSSGIQRPTRLVQRIQYESVGGQARLWLVVGRGRCTDRLKQTGRARITRGIHLEDDIEPRTRTCNKEIQPNIIVLHVLTEYLSDRSLHEFIDGFSGHAYME